MEWSKSKSDTLNTIHLPVRIDRLEMAAEWISQILQDDFFYQPIHSVDATSISIATCTEKGVVRVQTPDSDLKWFRPEKCTVCLNRGNSRPVVVMISPAANTGKSKMWEKNFSKSVCKIHPELYFCFVCLQKFCWRCAD